MQIDIQQFIDKHFSHISLGAILTTCVTFVTCTVKGTWHVKEAATDVKEARVIITETKEVTKTTLEEVKDLREDFKTLRPAIEKLTEAINNNSLVLAELKGQFHPVYRQ